LTFYLGGHTFGIHFLLSPDTTSKSLHSMQLPSLLILSLSAHEGFEQVLGASTGEI
jgi:hypothetical protein